MASVQNRLEVEVGLAGSFKPSMMRLNEKSVPDKTSLINVHE